MQRRQNHNPYRCLGAWKSIWRSAQRQRETGSPFEGPHFRRSSRTAPGSRCERGCAPLLADSFLLFLLGQSSPMSGERFLLEIRPELGVGDQGFGVQSLQEGGFQALLGPPLIVANQLPHECTGRTIPCFAPLLDVVSEVRGEWNGQRGHTCKVPERWKLSTTAAS